MCPQMHAVESVKESGAPVSRQDTIPEPDPVYCNQKKRYPWWVKSVDQVTIELDPELTERPRTRDTAAVWFREVHRENYEEVINEFPDIGLIKHLGTE